MPADHKSPHGASISNSHGACSTAWPFDHRARLLAASTPFGCRRLAFRIFSPQIRVGYAARQRKEVLWLWGWVYWKVQKFSKQHRGKACGQATCSQKMSIQDTSFSDLYGEALPTGSTPYLFTKTDLLFLYWNAKISSLFLIFKGESKPLRITYNMDKLPRYWDTPFFLFAFFSAVLTRPFESVFDQFMVETKFDSFPMLTLYLKTKISSTLFLFLFNCSCTHRHPLRWRSTISGRVTE